MPLKIGPKEFTKEQTIFLAVIGGVFLVFLLVVLGTIPGRKGGNQKIDLVVWGAGDDSQTWKKSISRFEKIYPKVSVEYVSIGADNYENDLLDALAAGTGPDVFMFHSKWLREHKNKITPIPSEKMMPLTFAGFFPQVAEQDFIADDRIYALPLTLDTLAIAYNRDVFDRNQVVFPPKTWEELQTAVLKIRVIDGETITRAAAAIGGTSDNVVNSTDILSVLIMQYGALIVDRKSDNVNFGRDGKDALEYYTQFSDPDSAFYTWDDSFGLSNEAFANEDVALTFVYPDDVKVIREENPFLDFEIRQLPQVDLTEPINFSSYWGLAVSSRSVSSDAAWDFAVFAATDSVVAQEYISKTGRSPALRFLIESYLTNPDIGVFAAQALTAKSWQQVNDDIVDDIFDGMIESVLSDGIPPRKAISEADSKLTQWMKRS